MVEHPPWPPISVAVEPHPPALEPLCRFADPTPVVDGQTQLTDTSGIGIEKKKALRDLTHRLFERGRAVHATRREPT